MSAFSEQQSQCLERAYAMLGEHFDGVVIAVMAEVQAADQAREAARVFYYGGRLQALGLCVEAHNQILNADPSGRESDA